MHRVYTEIKRKMLKLSGRYLIQDRKSYVLSIKIPIQLYLWNSIKYSKINEKHELLYKNIISWPLKYSDPCKQHVTAKKSKTSVSTTLIGLTSNLLWRQTFKNLRKKNCQDGREDDSGEKRAQSQYLETNSHIFFSSFEIWHHLSVLQHSQVTAARNKYAQDTVWTHSMIIYKPLGTV